MTFDPQLFEDSFNQYIASGVEVTEHMYLVFPNEALPRGRVTTDLEGRYINSDGSLGGEAYDGLSGLLTDCTSICTCQSPSGLS